MILLFGLKVFHAGSGLLFQPLHAYTLEQPIPLPTGFVDDDTGNEIDSQEGFCIPSGDHASIQNALTGVGSRAVLCPEAVFEPAVRTVTTDMWPLYSVVSESCVSELVGEALLDGIREGYQGPVWFALESAPNGERIGQCISIYEPPDISDLSGDVAVELLPCEPYCAELRLINLSDDTVDLRRVEFLLEGFPVLCVGLPDSLGPWEEAHCIVDDFVADGFQVLAWFGFRPDGGFWGFDYPFEPVAVLPASISTGSKRGASRRSGG